MSRNRRIWIIYGLATLLVVGALFQVSRVLVDAAFEKRRADEARRHQDRERVALWQLDFAIAPLIGYETGRAIALEAGVRPLGPLGEDFIRLRFDRRDPGLYRVTPPEGATGGDWCALEDLEPEFRRPLAVLALPEDPQSLVPATSELVDLDQAWVLNGASIPLDENLARNDLPGRQLQSSRSNALNPMANFANVQGGPALASIEPFRPVWIDRRDGAPAELVLVRRSAGGATIQFVLLDRDRLEAWLKQEVSELLPELQLAPQRDEARPGQSVLAALPYRLVSAAPPARIELDSSFMTTLGIAWGAVLLALGVTAFVLRATTTLSERRARFVSTVTHELRTPLTTFRMYAQMLHRDMVPDEDRRRAYLATLDEESERLSRVVESVLLYARLEEGRAEARREEIGLAELGDRLLVPLGRAAQAGEIELDLEVRGDEERSVSVDLQTIEQILVNLVDNAAKYGRGESPRVAIELEARGDDLLVTVADQGPGVPAGERRAIFEPFRRAREHAAGHAPGVGLGLALARGLARAQGGELELLPSRSGASFRLRLPNA